MQIDQKSNMENLEPCFTTGGMDIPPNILALGEDGVAVLGRCH